MWAEKYKMSNGLSEMGLDELGLGREGERNLFAKAGKFRKGIAHRS